MRELIMRRYMALILVGGNFCLVNVLGKGRMRFLRGRQNERLFISGGSGGAWDSTEDVEEALGLFIALFVYRSMRYFVEVAERDIAAQESLSTPVSARGKRDFSHFFSVDVVEVEPYLCALIDFHVFRELI